MTEALLSINEIVNKLRTSEFVLKDFSMDISLSLPTICHYDNGIAYKLFIYRTDSTRTFDRVSIDGVFYIDPKTAGILNFDRSLPKEFVVPIRMLQKNTSDAVCITQIKELRKRIYELFDNMHFYAFKDACNSDDSTIADITEYFSIMKKLSSEEMLRYYYYTNPEFFDWMLKLIS
ncbi:MAG: hypothetical protein ACYDIA_07315 [Candidatus Humimicrobiaceae bacterium]